MTIQDSSGTHQHPNVTNVQETRANVSKAPETVGRTTMAGAAEMLDKIDQLVQAGELDDHYSVVSKAKLRLYRLANSTPLNGGEQHG